MEIYRKLMVIAREQAEKSLREGGIPVGAVLADQEGNVICASHNRRVQNNDPTSHGETQCIKDAGRRTDWHKLILVSTLSPCEMCTGTTVLLKISTIVIGENQNFKGPEHWFQERGVEIVNLKDEKLTKMMRKFIQENPALWNEDIAIPEKE